MKSLVYLPWREIHRDYKIEREDGSRWVLALDHRTGATTLQRWQGPKAKHHTASRDVSRRHLYRVNYGNGQVDTFASLSEAKKAWWAQVEYDRRNHQSSYGVVVQQYMGDGEWATVARGFRKR